MVISTIRRSSRYHLIGTTFPCCVDFLSIRLIKVKITTLIKVRIRIGVRVRARLKRNEKRLRFLFKIFNIDMLIVNRIFQKKMHNKFGECVSYFLKHLHILK